MWYDYYKFDNEEQYLEWKVWAIEELKREGIEERFNEIDMIYGLNWRWDKKKEGQLF